MTIHDPAQITSHEDVLERLAQALDIPDTLLDEAERSYKALGEWLGRPRSSLADYEPDISPQGSFLLGTTIRPVSEADEYDLDLVCLLHSLTDRHSQKELKEMVGREVADYAAAHGMQKPEPGRRCWRLDYAFS